MEKKERKERKTRRGEMEEIKRLSHEESARVILAGLAGWSSPPLHLHLAPCPGLWMTTSVLVHAVCMLARLVAAHAVAVDRRTRLG
jgi:hypothetical protein